MSKYETIGHHIAPRSRGGTSEKVNILQVDEMEEKKMHQHFGIKIFHEKILQTIDEWDGQILTGDVKHDLKRILAEHGPDMYKKGVFKHGPPLSSFEKLRGLYLPKSNIGTTT